MRKFDKKYAIALQHLSKALNEVSNLVEFDNEEGRAFHDEVLCDRLGKCWGMSIDEMAYEVFAVAIGMYKMSMVPQEYIDDMNEWNELISTKKVKP